MMRRLSIGLCAGCASMGILFSVHADDAVPGQTQVVEQAVAGGSADPVPERLAQERLALAVQRDAILQTYEKAMAACWQKFAVNACLVEARRARRQALDPLAQQELALNAQERAWRSEQRERRLQDKQPVHRAVP